MENRIFGFAQNARKDSGSLMMVNAINASKDVLLAMTEILVLSALLVTRFHHLTRNHVSLSLTIAILIHQTMKLMTLSMNTSANDALLLTVGTGRKKKEGGKESAKSVVMLLTTAPFAMKTTHADSVTKVTGLTSKDQPVSQSSSSAMMNQKTTTLTMFGFQKMNGLPLTMSVAAVKKAHSGKRTQMAEKDAMEIAQNSLESSALNAQAMEPCVLNVKKSTWSKLTARAALLTSVTVKYQFQTNLMILKLTKTLVIFGARTVTMDSIGKRRTVFVMSAESNSVLNVNFGKEIHIAQSVSTTSSQLGGEMNVWTQSRTATTFHSNHNPMVKRNGTSPSMRTTTIAQNVTTASGGTIT
jgi:hypothetical protein